MATNQARGLCTCSLDKVSDHCISTSGSSIYYCLMNAVVVILHMDDGDPDCRGYPCCVVRIASPFFSVVLLHDWIGRWRDPAHHRPRNASRWLCPWPSGLPAASLSHSVIAVFQPSRVGDVIGVPLSPPPSINWTLTSTPSPTASSYPLAVAWAFFPSDGDDAS
jgi:hypothetical protein